MRGRRGGKSRFVDAEWQKKVKLWRRRNSKAESSTREQHGGEADATWAAEQTSGMRRQKQMTSPGLQWIPHKKYGQQDKALTHKW